MQNRILRLPDVIAATGLSRSTIYAQMTKGEFPRPMYLTGYRAVGWGEDTIVQWIHTRQQQRSAR